MTQGGEPTAWPCNITPVSQTWLEGRKRSRSEDYKVHVMKAWTGEEWAKEDWSTEDQPFIVKITEGDPVVQAGVYWVTCTYSLSGDHPPEMMIYPFPCTSSPTEI
jgi:hypothetical protein